jgi:hypothetical protein
MKYIKTFEDIKYYALAQKYIIFRKNANPWVRDKDIDQKLYLGKVAKLGMRNLYLF